MTVTKRDFQLAANESKFSRRIPALMGRYDNPGYTSTVPGGLGYVYVRVWQGSAVNLTIALNPNGVTTTGDTPIWLDKQPDGQLIVDKLRYTGS